MLSEPANSVSPTPVPEGRRRWRGANQLKRSWVFELQVGMLRGDEECKAVNAIVFFRWLCRVCHQRRAEGDSHTQRGLSGGSVSLCRLMSTCRPQCARCLLRLSLLFSSSLWLFYMLPFLLASLFFIFFFSRNSTRIQTKKKNRMSQYGACIWKNQTQHSCSASPIVKARY